MSDNIINFSSISNEGKLPVGTEIEEVPQARAKDQATDCPPPIPAKTVCFRDTEASALNSQVTFQARLQKVEMVVPPRPPKPGLQEVEEMVVPPRPPKPKELVNQPQNTLY